VRQGNRLTSCEQALSWFLVFLVVRGFVAAVGHPLQYNAHFVVRWEDCAFSSSEVMVLERGGDELNEAELV
jgi:hypothetical protein